MMIVTDPSVAPADISTVEMSDDEFTQRLGTLDTLAAEMGAAHDATEASKRRLLDARLAFARSYRALYLQVERDGVRVQQLRDKYELGTVDGSQWNVIGERAHDIRHLAEIDDAYYSTDRLRVPTTQRTIYALAAALNRDGAAVFAAFRDPEFEPTVRALDAIGGPSAAQPPESNLSELFDGGEDPVERHSDGDSEPVHREEPERRRADEVRSQFSNYLNQLHTLRETHEPQPPHDYHSEAARALDQTECVVFVVSYEFIKPKRVLRVVTDYEIGELDWEMLHGSPSNNTAVESNDDDTDREDFSRDDSDITEWMSTDDDCDSAPE
jgi:hypothetical protein